ncbi:MAG: D-alanyl-D-alanine carboxypeptidase/D-alanyl-D-alanine-endopeptidase [Myxococcales bacterium]|nr:D-alanyl-D-alanine carboxypeptidase/D-alanyl-D-alanine-endopeptidase [Myxococcales bacterium]
MPRHLYRKPRTLTLPTLWTILFAVLLTLPVRAELPPGDIGSQAVLQGRIEARIAEAGLGDAIGISVLNLQSGRSIVGHNATLPLNPASNMKLITAAVAMLELGPDFQMRTGLYGRQTGDAIEGGLYIRGFGDPDLRSADLIAMAQELVARGIRKVDQVLVDGSYFDDQILPPAFDQQPDEVSPFRAAIAAVSVNRSAYTMRVRPGASAGDAARVAVDAEGYFEISNRMTTSDGGPLNVIAAQGAQGDKDDKMSLRLSGKVPLGIAGASYTRRVESPLHYSGHVLVEALKALRIQVPRTVKILPTPRGAALLASRRSAPLGQLLSALGKNSDNFVAEMTLKVLAAEKVGLPGRSEAGAKHVLEVLGKLGLPIANIQIKNGSGLFEGNRVAASHLTKLLAAVHADPSIYSDYLAHLAVGGVDGTLSRRFKQLPAPRIVRAKTGTLADVIALSGYVLGPTSERTVAFSILLNGVRGKHHAARSLADEIVGDIALHLHAKAK